jgi:hypothetical protein
MVGAASMRVGQIRDSLHFQMCVQNYQPLPDWSNPAGSNIACARLGSIMYTYFGFLLIKSRGDRAEKVTFLARNFTAIFDFSLYVRND